ncbi:MAG: kelch repeat-containing protein [Terracidiphilus sp.]|jgi:N-acetylneuraminic acid mutarotase
MRKLRLMPGCLFGRLLGFVIFSLSSLSAAAQTTATWTWMGGTNNLDGSGGEPGVYGTLGTPASGNIPASRWDAVSWTDSNGNLWLFGGSGYDAAANDTGVLLNDLWEYNPSTNEWTWMGGSSTVTCTKVNGIPNCVGQAGVYGTLGTPAAGNLPGSRAGATSWTDGSGNLWLFGGSGPDAKGNNGILNDLWEFNPSMNAWAWMGGSSTLPPPSQGDGWPGVYGTLGTPAAGNIPGSRVSASTWTDRKGNFWLLGGTGYDANSNWSVLNDLWEFSPSTNEWAWMGGSSTVSFCAYGECGQPGVYGTLGTPAAGNIPGSRSGATSWIDGSGNFWLFGGSGFDAKGNPTALNDLWEFSPSTNEWAWMGGGTTSTGCITYRLGLVVCGGQPGVYGTLGTAAAGNIPGGRAGAASWIDGSGNFWLFGGQGFDSEGNQSNLNDLWEFSPSANEWAWMGGDATVTGCTIAPEGNVVCGGQPGVYGTLGTPDPGNNPGARFGASSWTDSKGNFWLFGGDGAAGVGGGVLNDFWEYQQATTALPATAAPTFSPASGVYNSLTAMTISVTIFDATPGATIYYTTDGTVPTTSSTVYSGPITVSSAGLLTFDTIQAIAIASGYSPSVMSSALYTIKLTPDFTVAASPASMTVTAGQSGTTTVTVTPLNGLVATVSFSCSGLPSGASCSFSPASVNTEDLVPVSTTLTVSTSATTATLRRNSSPLLPGAALAAVLCCFGWKKRGRLQMLLLLAVCGVGLSLLNGCGGGSQPTSYTITVNATSGSLSHSTTFLLTVQ